ncbi:MAG: hypothetical protein HZA93_15310 [Verrucomicrobia bacterium]|nr:hypothetical protein [Verrucomicrobiota bacterium]
MEKLRSRAMAEGVSVEEAHRRVLRTALIGAPAEPQMNFLDYLRSIPKADAVEFPRSLGGPRDIHL